jgi:hypothetical protein
MDDLYINLFLFFGIFILYTCLLYTTNESNIIDENVKLNGSEKKDCSQCKWELRKECTVVEGDCYEDIHRKFKKTKYKNEEGKCKEAGYYFVPSGVISRLSSERCDDMYAHACFDSENQICNSDVCKPDTWVPQGCKPYKEVGICLTDNTFDNKPKDCPGEYVVNGIVKA